MISPNNYSDQFERTFTLLCGSGNGLPRLDFIDVLASIPNPPSRADIESAFHRHSDDGKTISGDCMLEATAELQDSGNAVLVATTLVQAIERMHWRKLFVLVDEDNSGRVDVMELKSFVDALATVMQFGYTQQEASRWMREVGESEIDFETFIVVARRLIRNTPIISVVTKVEEAKRAVKERKASALNLFQAKVLGSMLRKRGATMIASNLPTTLNSLQSDGNNNNNGGGEGGSGGDNSRSQHVDPAAADGADIDGNVRRRSPAGVAAISSDSGSAEQHLMNFLHPDPSTSADAALRANDELLRLLSANPSVDTPMLSDPTQGRIDSVIQHTRSRRILSVLNSMCVEKDGVAEAPRTASALHLQCQRMLEYINGPSGTLLEMQRAAVEKIVKEANEFLRKLQPPPREVPKLRLGVLASGAGAESGAAAVSAGRDRSGTVMSTGQQRSRAQTVFEKSFGKDVERLCDMAEDKIATLVECRKEIGHVTADSVYAVSQIVAPRNKMVDMAMTLLPHARSSTALAKALRAFELQTQELHDMLAIFKVFSSGAVTSQPSQSRGGGGGLSRSASRDRGLDEETNNNNNNGDSSLGTGEPLTFLQLMKLVRDEKWGERPPAPLPERAADLLLGATVLASYVDDMFRKETATQWMRRLADVTIALSHEVKALYASFLRDRAVQTSTELLISLQNFNVNFDLRAAASANGSNSPNQADAQRDNAASIREKRRLAMAHARIRRSLVADVTRQAQSVDLLIRRYLSAGVMVPDNFGRVVSTDPDKRHRHTFRFGTRLIELSPTDGQKLSVHVGAGFFMFDEFCEKNSLLESVRLQREIKRERDAETAAYNNGNSAGRANPNTSNNHRSTSVISIPASGGARSSSSSAMQTQVVEFTVRSGSPVQVVPFPWLNEARSASAALAAQRSASTCTGGGDGAAYQPTIKWDKNVSAMPSSALASSSSPQQRRK